LTGTFGGSVQNSASDRSYPFSYTVSAANTWELETITIPGDTTGTWLTDSGVGIRLFFSLGTGSTQSGTAGAWAAGNFRSVTGAVSVVGTNGATFYITGVQLEAGSVATPFERRDFGRELMMAQRYYQITNSYFAITEPSTQTRTTGSPSLKVNMRAQPTVSFIPGTAFHRPAIAFYSVTSVVSGGSADGGGYVTVDIASGAGTLCSGQMNNGLIYSAEL
jgi:hypothetical protein